ncbi:hypothetical protein KP509_14G039500 [Ceratopteris richardii]|uniref:Uncharacterized protein n=2 Tax=Ceratopteris richardii TaxID=49495 RepID=A0A8T2TB70_CERRI|nr:hypothetical protein KP509_14G039500 [Ceratopteris richardii]
MTLITTMDKSLSEHSFVQKLSRSPCGAASSDGTFLKVCNVQTPQDMGEPGRGNTPYKQRMIEATADRYAVSLSYQHQTQVFAGVIDSGSQSDNEMKILQLQLQAQQEIDARNYESQHHMKPFQFRNREKRQGQIESDVKYKHAVKTTKRISWVESECQHSQGPSQRRHQGSFVIARRKAEISDRGTKMIVRKPLKGTHNDLSVQVKMEVDSLKQRLRYVEDEARFLKEAMVRRTAELDDARKLCAKTIMKLSAAQSFMESMSTDMNFAHSFLMKPEEQQTKTGITLSHAKLSKSDLINNSKHEEKDDAYHIDSKDEEICAESWALALFSELSKLSNLNEKSSIKDKELNDMLSSKRLLNVDISWPKHHVHSTLENVNQRLLGVGDNIRATSSLCDCRDAATCKDMKNEILAEVLEIKAALLAIERSSYQRATPPKCIPESGISTNGVLAMEEDDSSSVTTELKGHLEAENNHGETLAEKNEELEPVSLHICEGIAEMEESSPEISGKDDGADSVVSISETYSESSNAIPVQKTDPNSCVKRRTIEDMSIESRMEVSTMGISDLEDELKMNETAESAKYSASQEDCHTGNHIGDLNVCNGCAKINSSTGRPNQALVSLHNYSDENTLSLSSTSLTSVGWKWEGNGDESAEADEIGAENSKSSSCDTEPEIGRRQMILEVELPNSPGDKEGDTNSYQPSEERYEKQKIEDFAAGCPTVTTKDQQRLDDAVLAETDHEGELSSDTDDYMPSVTDEIDARASFAGQVNQISEVTQEKIQDFQCNTEDIQKRTNTRPSQDVTADDQVICDASSESSNQSSSMDSPRFDATPDYELLSPKSSVTAAAMADIPMLQQPNPGCLSASASLSSSSASGLSKAAKEQADKLSLENKLNSGECRCDDHQNPTASKSPMRLGGQSIEENSEVHGGVPSSPRKTSTTSRIFRFFKKRYSVE